MPSGDFISFLVIVLLLGGTAIFISYPFLRRNPEAVGEDYYAETRLHELLSRKNSIYSAIKDTEFEYKTGKLSDEDYTELQAKHKAEARDVLKAIDDLGKPKKRATAGETEAAEELYCAACGFQYEKGDRFCPSCGEAL